jgi:PhnB protein
MNSISAYIGFNGKCREAMTFYQECLGGQLELLEVAGSPMEQFWPEGKDKIYHSALDINGLLIMGTDMTGPKHTPGNNISMAIGCGSEEEINTLFAKLSEGGNVLDPLKQQFWGDIFGALEDKFGIRWMLNYAKQKD